jgi:AraC-like DNA-binding protein
LEAVVSLCFEELRLHRFDPDALSHVLDSTELEHRVLAGGALNVHSRQLRWGDLVVSVCGYSFPALVRGSMPVDGGVYIGVLGSATGETSLNLRPLPAQRILLYARGSEAHCHARAGSEWMMLRLPLDRLQETAAAHHGLDLDWPGQGVRYVDLPSEVGVRLRGELRALLRFGQRFADVFEAELIESLVGEGMVQLVVEAIARGSRSANSALSVGRIRALQALESSIERWMKDPDERLRITDIQGARQRLLEMASRELYEMTPQHWCKLARLNAAYRELRHGHYTSVTDLCAKLGFGNMGRFAAEYQRLFGETPRETLLGR